MVAIDYATSHSDKLFITTVTSSSSSPSVDLRRRRRPAATFTDSAASQPVFAIVRVFQCRDADMDDAGNGRSRRSGKANDVFVSFDDMVPVTFVGVRAHVIGRFGARRPMPGPWSLPATDADPRRWSATSMIKVHRGDMYPDGVSMSTACDVRWPGCLTYAMTDLKFCNGHWNFEASTRFSENRVHLSVVAQVANWNRLVTARYGVDYLWPRSTASISVEPEKGKCSFQFLKSLTDRLSASGELAYTRNKYECDRLLDAKQFGVAATFKYAGPSYLFSGKASSATNTVRLAYYHHYNERLQIGTTVGFDVCRSAAVSRVAFRVMCDASSVFRAAVGTDGVVNSLWEKRLSEHVSLSLSMFVNHVRSDHGVGVGLSFG